MPIVRDFTYDEDADSGLTGLVPAWFENATVTVGRGVAHDMLEHFKTQSGPLEGECEALGAVLALRIQYGWTSRFSGAPGADVQAGAIIAEMLRDYFYAEQDLALPRHRRSRPISDNDWLETVIRGALDYGFRVTRENNDDGDTHQEELAAIDTVAVREAFTAWIRRGYRRTLKRYAKFDLYTLGISFFEEISKTVDKLLTSEALAFGDRVRVSLDPGLHRVAIRVNGNCASEFGYL